MDNTNKNQEQKNLSQAMDSFLGENPKPQNTAEQEMDCSSGVCVIKDNKGIVERINKKIIVEDGRQLLI